MTEEFGHPSLRPVVFGVERTICCHRAGLSGHHIPNSLAAISECVSAGVPRLEIDVRFLADGAIAVFHDRDLEHDTTGSGPIETWKRESLAEVRHKADHQTGIAFLEDVVEVMAGSATLLQVDLKPLSLIPVGQLQELERVLRPMGDGVIVGSQGHWNLRRLAGVPIAFDPWLQFRHQPGRKSMGGPHTLGFHGMWDDSPVAVSPFFSAAEYVETRIDDLVPLLPRTVEWMVDIPTVLHIGALGVRLGEALARRGISLAAWTLRESSGDPDGLMGQLFAVGTTTVITDMPLAAAAAATRLASAAA